MMTYSLIALITCAASTPLATTTAFVVPTGGFIRGAVAGAETQQKQAKSMSRGLGMAVDDSMNGAESSSRIGFLRKQGALGVAAMSTLGWSSPAAAKGLFDVGQNDKIELEEVPRRMIIGQTQTIRWATVAPTIVAMRAEARERFSKTGAKGGREVSSYSKVTADGADVTVGLEVADTKASPAIGDGFTATVMAPPGKFLRSDHAAESSVATWMTFMARIPKSGYELSDSLSMFEVYTGTGGDEGVSMYAAVK